MPDEIIRRVGELEKGHRILQTQLAANTQLTQQIKNDTGALLDLLSGARTGAMIIGRVAKFIKWSGGIAASIAAVWYLGWCIKNGHLPSAK